jgi:hypothetical protein
MLCAGCDMATEQKGRVSLNSTWLKTHFRRGRGKYPYYALVQYSTGTGNFLLMTDKDIPVSIRDIFF